MSRDTKVNAMLQDKRDVVNQQSAEPIVRKLGNQDNTVMTQVEQTMKKFEAMQAQLDFSSRANVALNEDFN